MSQVVTAGIGLRHVHHRDALESRPPVGFLEVHPENYLGGGGAVRCLTELRRDYPVSLHAVGLSLGTDGPLDRQHLSRLACLVERIEPWLVSEHLSWCSAEGVYLNDLLPLPYTEEALAVVARHVEETQEALERQILIENPSTYLRFAHSTLSEWEFLAEVVRRTGCAVLLDINNLYVSAMNHGFAPGPYLEALPPAAVREIHLAGHHVKQVDGVTLRIDDHGSKVDAAVWALYREAIARFGLLPTLIEWDTDIPPLPVLVGEAAKADAILEAAARQESDRVGAA